MRAVIGRGLGEEEERRRKRLQLLCSSKEILASPKGSSGKKSVVVESHVGHKESFPGALTSLCHWLGATWEECGISSNIATRG